MSLLSPMLRKRATRRTSLLNASRPKTASSTVREGMALTRPGLALDGCFDFEVRGGSYFNNGAEGVALFSRSSRGEIVENKIYGNGTTMEGRHTRMSAADAE